MSLRQYAAIEAMKSLIRHGTRIFNFAGEPKQLAQMVKDSYDIADAMITYGEKS